METVNEQKELTAQEEASLALAMRPRDANGKFLARSFREKQKEGIEKIITSIHEVANMTVEELAPKAEDSVLVAGLKQNWREFCDPSNEYANLAAKAKWLDTQLKAAGVYERNVEFTQPIKVVIFSHPEAGFGQDHTKIVKAEKPSWVTDAEVIQQNAGPPDFTKPAEE